jgi:vacuolar-type H+-ATPase subunit I/STV1
VLGFVTGGLSALVSLLFLLMAVIGGQDDPVSMLLILGLPCAAGLISGAARLLSGDLPGPLFGWAIAAVGVLVVAALVALVAFDAADLLAVAIFVVLAVPLPVLTAVFAWRPDTRDWASEAR